MKKSFISLFNIAFLILQLAGDIIYMIVGNPYLWKVFASLTFFIGGLVNLFYVVAHKSELKNNNSFKYIMIVGLFFAMLGDILLIDYFVIGAGLFAVGHIWFFIAYCTLEKIKLRDILYAITIFAFALAVELLIPIFDYDGMTMLVIIYAFVISIMLGKAISNYIGKRNSLAYFIIMLGSVLFFLSDLMLLFNVFGGVGIWADNLCLIFYYPAEYLLAISIFYASKDGAVRDGVIGVD